ncbi:MAG: endonuclease/exonuclease/phosphatase family protein [Cypionkella sp.]|nr:endonuclease/exonuclease/phosphatase family protein [Cypionkella sp.]
MAGGTAQQQAVIASIAALDADVLLLTGIDYDAGGQTLTALVEALTLAGVPYPYQLPLRPNSGVPTGFDLNGNGRLGEARDAMAYGRYMGEGGMAVISRLPIDAAQIRDFTAYLWADLPQNLSPDTDTALRGVQRLSSGGHYEVPITLPNGGSLRLLAYYATPPAFDGADDRNGKRNHDETAFWLRLLAGDLPFDPPQAPFAIIGQSSLDPLDGQGRPAALRQLLAHPALQDPQPRGASGRKDAGQAGDPALDTALYGGLGGLRVEYILPSRDLTVAGAGVVWPADRDPAAAMLATASRHRPVWVDVALP